VETFRDSFGTLVDNDEESTVAAAVVVVEFEGDRDSYFSFDEFLSGNSRSVDLSSSEDGSIVSLLHVSAVVVDDDSVAFDNLGTHLLVVRMFLLERGGLV
jgi:hypothetical protein